MSRRFNARHSIVAAIGGALLLALPGVAYGQNDNDCPDPVSNPQGFQACVSQQSSQNQDPGGQQISVDQRNIGGGNNIAINVQRQSGAGTSRPVATRRARFVRDFDCSDFSSQSDAQRVLNANTADPFNLDTDNDGVACEGRFGFVSFRRVVFRHVLARTGPHALEIALAGVFCLLGSFALRRRLIPAS